MNFPAADNESTDEDEECCNVTSDSDSSSANKPSKSQWKVVDNLSIDKPQLSMPFHQHLARLGNQLKQNQLSTLIVFLLPLVTDPHYLTS